MGNVNYRFVTIYPNRRGCSSSHFLAQVIITIIITARPAKISCHGCRDGKPQCCETAVEKLLFCLTKYTHKSVWSAVYSHSFTVVIFPLSETALAHLGFRVSLASNLTVTGGESTLQVVGFGCLGVFLSQRWEIVQRPSGMSFHVVLQSRNERGSMGSGMYSSLSMERHWLNMQMKA